MKIAIIINSLVGGKAERVVQTLSNSFVNKGYEIHVFLLNDNKVAYFLDARVKVHLLKTSIISKGIGKVLFIPIQSLELLYMLRRLGINKAISFLVRANFVFSLLKVISDY